MFRITDPCSRRWTDFPGDERRRFCGDCGKFVHDIAAYSKEELAALGPICGYVGGETFGLGQTRRAVMTGVFLTTISPLLAQDGRVRVVVTDVTGATSKGAEVRIGERRLKTDALGVVSFVGLPVGRVAVVASSSGFRIWRGTINLLNGAELQVDAHLEVIEVGGGFTIEPVRSEAPGRLTVSVRDATKAALVNADILVNCADGSSRKARTDEAGVASLTWLPVGNCQVEASAPGFNVWRGSFAVAAGGEGQLEARLEVSDPGTKVAVRPKPVGRRFLDWLSSCARR